MSLRWDLSEIKNWKEVNTDEEWPITDRLIWGTMIVGINPITETNWREFYARFHLVELLNGAFLLENRKPRYIKPEEVQRRVGLNTNASSLTRPAFLKLKLNRYFKELVETPEA